MCQYWIVDYPCCHIRTQLHKCHQWQDCKEFRLRTVYTPSDIRCEWCEKSHPQKFRDEDGELHTMGSRDFTYETPESGKPGDVHAERILGPKLKDIVEWLTGTEPASNGRDGDGAGDGAGEGDRDGGDGRGGGGDDDEKAAAATAAATTCTKSAKRLN